MKEKEIAQELTKLLFVLKQESRPTGNRKEGMGHRDMMMLAEICEMEKTDLVKMNNISDFFHITPAAVSQCIRNFEHEGWIERVVLEHDRRSVYIKVSDKAKKELQVCQDEMWKRLLNFIQYLGQEDSSQLLRILDKAILFIKEEKE